MVRAFLERQKQIQKHGPWPLSFAGIRRSRDHGGGARSEEILGAEFVSR